MQEKNQFSFFRKCPPEEMERIKKELRTEKQIEWILYILNSLLWTLIKFSFSIFLLIVIWILIDEILI